MFIVYVLYSQKYKKIYIGYTSNLKQRMLSHNELATKGYTVKYRPWIIVLTENFDTKKEALNREKALKSGKGREYIWKEIENRGLLSALGGRPFESGPRY
jgi:putative endonuclease